MSRRRFVFPGLVILFATCLTLIVGVLLSARARAQVGPPLTNDDVIKMVRAKLPDAVVVAKIRSSPCKFDTSTDTLIKLKQVGVSDAVLQAMAESGTAPAKPGVGTGPSPAPVPAPAGLPTEIGVYFKKGDEWVEVQPEVVNWKTGGVMKTFATGGIVKGDVNGHINGPHSHNSVRTPLEFLIYTPEGVAITEYQLLRLREQKDSREFRTVTGGVMHVSGGATRDQVPFESKKLASRTFSVTLPSLGAGEFGFLPPGAVMSGHASSSLGKMYTFHLPE